MMSATDIAPVDEQSTEHRQLRGVPLHRVWRGGTASGQLPPRPGCVSAAEGSHRRRSTRGRRYGAASFADRSTPDSVGRVGSQSVRAIVRTSGRSLIGNCWKPARSYVAIAGALSATTFSVRARAPSARASSIARRTSALP